MSINFIDNPNPDMDDSQREPVYPKYIMTDNTEHSVTNDDQRVMRMNCLDISRHIQACPLCSSVYRYDKWMYTIAIAVLISIIALLLRKNIKL